MPTPTAEQLAALKDYARTHGPKWKSELMREWHAGQSTGLLQQINEEFGPSWLFKYKLPGFSAARRQFRRAS